MRKIESLIFYLLIFAVPFQSRLILHKWGGPLAPHLSLSDVGAGFNQWTSGYLYSTDILIAVLFFLWAIRCFIFLKNPKSQIPKSKQIPNSKIQIFGHASFWLIVFFVISAISIFNSLIPALSWYQLLKLAEFIGFFFYLKHNLGKVFNFRTTLAVVIGSGLFQAVIAITQHLKQSAVGLRLLGESPLSVNATGVAVFIADGEKFLRSYGTTPHPNILAAWLLLAIFAFYNYYFSGSREKLQNIRWPILAIPAVLFWGFFSTFSRTLIGLWILGSLIRLALLSKSNFREFLFSIKKRLFAFTGLVITVSVLFAVVYWPQVQSRIHISTQEEAVTQRIFYNQIAGSAAVAHPFLGIGTGQFVAEFMSKFKNLPPAAYQPVHNLYLMIASETGFLGLTAFVFFLFFVVFNFIKTTRLKRPYYFSFLILASSFIAVGLFDHFLWTSQQGSLIFWMVLAILNIKRQFPAR